MIRNNTNQFVDSKETIMNVTLHAAERFLQRVMQHTDFSNEDLLATHRYLLRIFTNVVPRSSARPFVFPEFEKFLVIHRDYTVITIIPKKS
jgi:hypothetical protein